MKARKYNMTKNFVAGRDPIFIQVIDELHNYNWAGLKEIADEAGVCDVTLYNWRNKTVSPRLNGFVRVARVLGYEVTLKRVGPAPKKKPMLRRVK